MHGALAGFVQLRRQRRPWRILVSDYLEFVMSVPPSDPDGNAPSHASRAVINYQVSRLHITLIPFVFIPYRFVLLQCGCYLLIKKRIEVVALVHRLADKHLAS